MVISADLLRGYTDAVILRRLEKKDGYGYQISKEVTNISGGRLEFEFQRTLSRLLEMQSHEYLTRPHRP